MNRLSKDTKLTIQLCLAIVLIIVGVILLFLGFGADPYGEIHDSVLVAYGEVSTFSGSLLGLDYSYKYKLYKARLDRKIEDVEEEDANNI